MMLNLTDRKRQRPVDGQLLRYVGSPQSRTLPGLPLVRLQDAQRDLRSRRLARAVRADQRYDLAGLQRRRYATHEPATSTKNAGILEHQERFGSIQHGLGRLVLHVGALWALPSHALHVIPQGSDC